MYFRKTPVSSVFCIMMVASMYKGKHLQYREIFRKSDFLRYPQSLYVQVQLQLSALKITEFSAVEVGESRRVTKSCTVSFTGS